MNRSTKMPYAISSLSLLAVALILLLFLMFSMSFSFDDPLLRPAPTAVPVVTSTNSGN